MFQDRSPPPPPRLFLLCRTLCFDAPLSPPCDSLVRASLAWAALHGDAQAAAIVPRDADAGVFGRLSAWPSVGEGPRRARETPLAPADRHGSRKRLHRGASYFVGPRLGTLRYGSKQWLTTSVYFINHLRYEQYG